MQSDRRGHVNIIFYDLPTTYELSLRHYRVFRKKLLKLGYYQLQESVYFKSYNDKSVAKKSINQIKQATPDIGNIRALIVTQKTFDEMEVILGELTTQERIVRKKSNIVEF